jgi:hypothetical protein
MSETKEPRLLDELLGKAIVKKEDLEWVTDQVIAFEQSMFRRAYQSGAQDTINYISLGLSEEKVNDWVYGDLQDWAAKKGRIKPIPEIKE